MVCLVVSSLLLIWSCGCREGLCGVFGCIVFVIDRLCIDGHVGVVRDCVVWFGCIVFVIDLVRWVS